MAKPHIFATEKEAELLGEYLLKAKPTKLAKELYMRTISQSPGLFSEADTKLWRFIHNNRWSIGLIDSGLALSAPESEIRRRLYLMFAILECMPEYADRFVPGQAGKGRLWGMLFSGFRAAVRGIAGIIFIKIIS